MHTSTPMLKGVTQVSTAPSLATPPPQALQMRRLGALMPHHTQALYNKWMCDRMLVRFGPPLCPLYAPSMAPLWLAL